MKRKGKILTGIGSAIIAFSVLWVTIGKPKYLDRHYFKTTCHTVNEPNTK